MGTINHNAVIATTSSDRAFEEVRCIVATLSLEEKNLFLFGEVSSVNGFRTVVMVPDGSKEGWSESDDGDALRKKFISLLESFSHDWRWVEVGFGELGQHIVSGNNTLDFLGGTV